ncbi:hypothetical protein [Kiloniella laminariae]|uniref:hypothetical protein n=1 Tax=Kiloniella laminariae TaxID=454162 RepID=UPI00037078E2|nr:hypothetical protein [Kiloniella laminariae]
MKNLTLELSRQPRGSGLKIVAIESNRTTHIIADFKDNPNGEKDAKTVLKLLRSIPILNKINRDLTDITNIINGDGK